MAASGLGDPSLEIWDLDWLPYALGHGHNPFLTNFLVYPSGVNLADNTSVFLPALLLSPVTVIFGPVMSYGVAGTLAPALSGWCAYLMVRRFTSWYPAAILGGLFYGFSPFMVVNLPYSHLQFTWFMFPPLLVIVLHELLVRQERSRARYGVYLGLLLAGQFYTGTEVLAMSAILGLGSLVYLVATNMSRVREHGRHASVGLGVGVGLFLVLVGYPLYVGMAGTGHFDLVPWSSVNLGISPTHIVTTPVNSHVSLPFTRVVGYFGAIGPDMDYLGVALAVLLLAGIVRWWRDGVLRWSAVMFVVCTVLAIGIPTEPPGGSTPWTPWRIFSHLPFLREMSALHFVGMGTLFVALAFGIVLDRFRTSLVGWWRSRSRRSSTHIWVALISATVFGVGVGALVPVYQSMSFPFVMQSVRLPAWFTHEEKHLPTDATLLVLPNPSSIFTQSMTWQAVDDMGFRQVGGLSLVVGANGQIDHTPPGAVGKLLVGLSSPSGPSTALPAASLKNLTVLRSFIRVNRVDDVVATKDGDSPAYAVGFMTAALGEPPRYEDGSWVWLAVQNDHRSPLVGARTTVSSCTVLHRDPGAVARCVVGPTQ